MTRAEIFEADEAATDVAEQVAEVIEPDTTSADEAKSEKEAKQEASDAEHMPNVEAFYRVVEEVIESADSDTGTVSEQGKQSVADSYRAVTGGIKYKNLAKNHVAEAMQQAIRDREYIKAVALNEVNDKLLTTKAEPKASAPKVDPKEAYATRVAAMEVALEVLTSRVPDEAEGFEIPSTDRAFSEVVDYLDWAEADEDSRGEAPELSAIGGAALKLVQGKGLGKKVAAGTRTPFTGTRRDVAAHIASAFETVDSGEFLTVSAIARHSSEEYGDDHPSSGAVSARLFPSSGKPSTIEGVVPGTNADGVKGATKE